MCIAVRDVFIAVTDVFIAVRDVFRRSRGFWQNIGESEEGGGGRVIVCGGVGAGL